MRMTGFVKQQFVDFFIPHLTGSWAHRSAKPVNAVFCLESEGRSRGHSGAALSLQEGEKKKVRRKGLVADVPGGNIVR